MHSTSVGTGWRDDVRIGLVAYYLTSLPVLLGLYLGSGHTRIFQHAVPGDPFLSCFHGNGEYYNSIASNGYQYDPTRRSTVAFFPAYPLCARALATATGITIRDALVLTSNCALALSFIFLSQYTSLCFPTAQSKDKVAIVTLFGLWPVGFFFRVAYSESFFILFELLFLIALRAHWRVIPLIVIAGLLTATRPVGIAATFALAVYIWTTRRAISRWSRVIHIVVYAPIACWGILAYIVYQNAAFDDPLAFARTQSHWSYNIPQLNDCEYKARMLLIGEPIWSIYCSSSPRYWLPLHLNENPLLGLYFWNPIFFGLAFLVTLYGRIFGRLTSSELTLCILLLLIPYCTRAYEMSMIGHARFASILMPLYVFAGTLITSVPSWLRWTIYLVFIIVLVLWTALFSARHPLF